ncbi:MAG: hypothetical protein H0U44_08985 [Flavisolibacter sp.]|nr:hypothetical protein [Flavisolibacter sp.]
MKRTDPFDYSEKVNFSRPSIDVNLETAADTYGAAVVAIIISGSNGDDTQRMRESKNSVA